ncbi:MAG: hypothetical protein RLZZ490_876 [Cyanobacteriota bacterium]
MTEDRPPSSDSSPSPPLINPSPPRKTGRWSTWQRQIRYFYVRLLRLQSTPQALARGLAAGAFAGMFPFLGLQTAIALVLAIPLRGNKLVAAAATWISNPFTYVPIFWFNYKLGQLILRSEGPAFADLDWQSGEILQYTSSAAIALLVGSTIAGVVVGLSAYIFGLKGFIWLRTRRENREKNPPRPR